MLVPSQQNPQKALRSPEFLRMSNQGREEEACVPKAEATSVAVSALEPQEELVWELVVDHPEQLGVEDRDQDEVEAEGGVGNVRNLRNRKRVLRNLWSIL